MKSNVIFETEYETQYIYYRHSKSVPSSENFKLHTHSCIEILIFIDGDADYIVEGNIYPLKPYDILITKSNEMHQVKHRSNEQYERVVISLTDLFFEKYECGAYKNFFTAHPIGSDNCIRLGEEDKEALKSFFLRTERYIKDAEGFGCSAAINCAAVEFAHFLNFVHKNKSADYTQNHSVNKILNYINGALSEDLTLDAIANYMYMSKYHLCRIFKQHTGLTINNYIANKRILLARKYYMQGQSLSEACIAAGFPSYCSFYKTYHNFTGKAPKGDIENYMNDR